MIQRSLFSFLFWEMILGCSILSMVGGGLLSKLVSDIVLTYAKHLVFVLFIQCLVMVIFHSYSSCFWLMESFLVAWASDHMYGEEEYTKWRTKTLVFHSSSSDIFCTQGVFLSDYARLLFHFFYISKVLLWYTLVKESRVVFLFEANMTANWEERITIKMVYKIVNLPLVFWPKAKMVETSLNQLV